MAELVRLDALPAALRVVNLAGEALKRHLVEAIHDRRPEVAVYNLYGPSEDTTYSIFTRVSAGVAEEPSIGRPIDATRARVCDRHLALVPVGVAGELSLAGRGVARGYLAKPALTARSFVPDPYARHGGERLYRTGDLARLRGDGELAYLGRLDHQVKIRGFRIEPGEVEVHLLRHPAVREAVVVARREQGEPRLVGYAAVKDGRAGAAELRRYLEAELPVHMVPAALVVLERLPLLPNGKVDRGALPDPEWIDRRPGLYMPPRGPMEQWVAEAFSAVLGVTRIGAHDNFFELGGHSLSATQVVSRLRRLAGAELPVRTLFEAPTVARLASRLEAARGRGSLTLPPPITAVARAELAPEPCWPASFAQERLWFLDRFENDRTIYSMPAAQRLRGALRTDLLASSLAALTARHESLRTVFATQPGEDGSDQVMQWVRRPAPVALPVVDLAALPTAWRVPEARRRARLEAHRTFDLARGPLLRAGLLRLDREDHVLLLTLHHIVSDGWSMGVLWRELDLFYGALARGSEPPLAPLSLQYADFAHWQRRWLAGAELERQLGYWRARLADLPPVLELPADRPRPAARTNRGAELGTRLTAAEAAALHKLGQDQGASLFMVLLAAFQALLGRYTSRRDVPVATPVANRNQLETEGLIGFFVNTLVLRGELEDDPTFAELLERSREVTLEALAHQDLPFEKLVGELVRQREMSHPPLVQVLLVLQNTPSGAARLDALTREAFAIQSDVARFDLTLAYEPRERGLSAGIEYDRDLFDATTIRRLAGHLRTLLATASAEPARPLSRLPVLAGGQRQQLLVEWTDTLGARPQASIAALFAFGAARAPESVALEMAGTRSDTEQLSYGELDRRANRLARHLCALGVGSETLVGLCMDRSLEQTVALVAILKAGGAYLPLDPDYPRERLALMLDDGRVEVLVVHHHLLGELPAGLLAARRTRVVCPRRDQHLVAARPDTAPAGGGSARQLAYVVYTSGSTGRPKGVAVAQESVVRLVKDNCFIGFGPGERFLQLAPIAFDASTLELWGSLLHGARLVVFPPRAPSLDELAAIVEARRISTLWLTAGLFHRMVEDQLPALLGVRQLLAGGDALSLTHVRRVLAALPPGHLLVNGYGPTENTTFTTTWAMRRGARLEESVPIGRTIRNTYVHVLDQTLSPLPVGVPGELCIGGVGLARGYLGRAAVTAERFVPDPLSPGGMRLYRSGDLVRQRVGGTLDFLGRSDHQVKVRGFRVEPGEIETRLTEHPRVRVAVVLAQPANGGGGERQLVAYVVPDVAGGETGVSPEELRQFLDESLPEFMVPAAFVVLENLPLTPNGKVDRTALSREAPAAPYSEAGSENPRVAPRGPLEELVSEVWREVLGVSVVGVHDDFFALGGHSLSATQLVSRLNRLTGTDLALRVAFEAPTVAGLAEHLGSKVPGAQGPLLRAAPPLEPVTHTAPAPASFAQERLWFLDRLGVDPASYNLPLAARLRGPLDAGALEAALNEIVRRHEVLRTRFVAGGQGIVQIVESAAGQPLPIVDLTALPGPARDLRMKDLLETEALKPFSLEHAALQRATLLRLGATGTPDEEHVLMLTQHHIASDGWSVSVMLRELKALYEAFASGGRCSPLAPLPIRYRDYAVWQRGWLEGEVLEAELKHWCHLLDGAPALLELPTDRPRPPFQSFEGAIVPIVFDADLSNALHAVSRFCGVTLFMTLLAALQSLLARYAGVTDVTVGTPIANRHHREVEGLIGFFVNTLAMRGDLSGDPAFTTLARRIREVTLDAYAHQDVPLEKLVEALEPQRNLSHSPLFQVMLSFENTPTAPWELAGLEVETIRGGSGTAKFDLNLGLTQTPAGLRGALEYALALFDTTTARRLARHFVTLLRKLVAEPDRPLSNLALLGDAERHMALVAWNDTRAPVDDRNCLHTLFERAAARAPEAPAVVSAGEELTYRELEACANRLARQLRALGVAPGSLVGVHLGRGHAMVVAVLAVLKAGGAYVPLEVTWPAERLRFIVARQGVDRVVTEASRLAALAEVPGFADVVCVDEPADDVAGRWTGARLWSRHDVEGHSSAAPDRGPRPRPIDLAYVIFTSGSTGRPKGVVVRHRPAVNLVRWVNSTFGVGPGDRLFFVTALSFDLSVYDIFGTLAAGGTIRIASAEELRDPQRQVEILCKEPITFWDSAPAALQQLAPLFPDASELARRPDLRLVFLSGDWIPVTLPERIRAAFRGAEVVSLGGATEATVWSNFHRVRRVEPHWTSIPYGRPITNARYVVLDGRLEPCPFGVAGDLFIGDACLSTCYAGEPILSARAYVPDPHSGVGTRLYHTGDRARHWADGTMEFLGRLDTQVKVRGFRIELGEIEVALARHPRIAELVAMVREDTPGDQRLVAYFLAEGEAPATAELRELARSKLPEYMVPSAFVELPEWPLSPTGKLDRKALPPPSAAAPVRAAAQTPAEETSAPSRSNALEQAIGRVWREIIGLEAVDPRDNFFEVGGHSLLMALVRQRLVEELGREIPLVDLFRFPTVRSLAEHLAPKEESKPSAEPVATRQNAPRQDALRQNQAIAVIGMAGRFPGAGGLDKFWENLAAGVESIRFFSDEELVREGFDPALLGDPGLVKARGALEGSELFDAAFFGYSPREAQIMDPQQRHFLEIAWSALEHAGYGSPVGRRRVGVFAGVTENTYVLELLRDPELLASVGRHQVSIANNPDYLPTRVSYKLDLDGPSVNVQTACSTSLVAVHLACRSLQAGDCDLALAGGASVQAHEVAPYHYQEGGIASPDGHTRTFDARAAGVVGGSGVAGVVLKRLSDAEADGDTIHAVVRGSAINNDGARKVGFTAPSVDGQARAIAEALRAAGVDPETLDYVEAHGTGTALGDPIEIAGLSQAYAETAKNGNGRCGGTALGSLKTNVGHLDAAAGVSGLIKTVLALEHRQIPPSLHFDRPNPAIDFAAGPFFVNTELAAWKAGARPRRAGVSSFGIGGTNAHVILEEAPAATATATNRDAQLLVLSARTATALDRAGAGLADHLERHPELELADVAYTLQVGRQHFSHRRTLVARDRLRAIAELREGSPHTGAPAVAEEAGRAPAVVFLFPGQGAQFVGMAEDLYRREALFRETLDLCAKLALPHLGLDLRDLLYPPEGACRDQAAAELRRTAHTQVALFAVEHALARLWMSWGVMPAALLGHSLGEYVAACLAGVFSLEDALRLVVRRGQLMQSMPPGDMLAVALSEDEVHDLLAGRSDELSLASVNAPRACVVSGTAQAVGALAAELADHGVDAKVLHTSHAFHSAMMEPILEPFAGAFDGLRLAAPEIPWVSNLTGTWITAEEATDPDYWCRHLRGTVRFAQGMKEVLGLDGAGTVLLEVGPGRGLATLARQHPCKSAAVAIRNSLRHPRDTASDLERLLGAAGELWSAGAEIDWQAFHAGPRRRVPLPTYPFERQPYWVDSKPAAIATATAGNDAAAGNGAGLSEVEETIAAVWRRLLGVGELSPDDDFFDLGGSSLMAIQVGAQLREALDVELPSDFLLTAPTLGELAELVGHRKQPQGAAGNGRPSCLVPLQKNPYSQKSGGRPPLFMVHQVGGHVYTFRALTRSLGKDQPLYGLRSRGLEPEEEPFRRVEDMAAHYLGLIREVQEHGPYHIGGASMGGVVAFEMAHQLAAEGEDVALLTMMDTPGPDQLPPQAAEESQLVTGAFAGRLELARDELKGLEAEAQLAYAVDKARRLGMDVDLDESRRLVEVLRGNVQALFAYRPRPWAGRMLFLRAEERRAFDPPRPELVWMPLAEGGAEVLLVPGNHETMHEAPNVHRAAGALRERLDRSFAEGGRA